MPAVDRANAKEYGDAAELHSISRRGGPLSEAERDRLLRAVETLRRDDLTIYAGVVVMLPGIYETGVRLDRKSREKRLSALRKVYGRCVVVPPAPAAPPAA
jgi:hypothetical protein